MINMKKYRTNSNSYHNLAVTILKKSEEPMTASEMIKIILEKKTVRGKTPVNSLRSMLQRSDTFKKVGKSKYVLNENI